MDFFFSFEMDNANDENLRKNLWQHQQHGNGESNQQFYSNQYQVRVKSLHFPRKDPADGIFFQPMQHGGFDLQRELNQQQAPPGEFRNIADEEKVLEYLFFHAHLQLLRHRSQQRTCSSFTTTTVHI